MLVSYSSFFPTDIKVKYVQWVAHPYRLRYHDSSTVTFHLIALLQLILYKLSLQESRDHHNAESPRRTAPSICFSPYYSRLLGKVKKKRVRWGKGKGSKRRSRGRTHTRGERCSVPQGPTRHQILTKWSPQLTCGVDLVLGTHRQGMKGRERIGDEIDRWGLLPLVNLQLWSFALQRNYEK